MAAQRAKKVGGRLRELRKERLARDRKWTQAYIAGLVAERVQNPSITSTYVSRWERGEHEPGDENLEALAEVFDTTVGDLVSGPLDERKPKGPTPDLLGDTQLDRMEGKLDQLLEASGATSPETDADEGIDGSPKTPGEEPSPQADRDEPETERGG